MRLSLRPSRLPCGLPGLQYRGKLHRECIQGCTSRGLADEEIWLAPLGEKNHNMSVEEVLQIVEAKEAGKRSAGQLLQSQGAEATAANIGSRPPAEDRPTYPMKPATTADKPATVTKHHPNNANKSAQHLVLPATFVVNRTTLGPPARVKTSPSTEEPHPQQTDRGRKCNLRCSMQCHK